EREGPPEDEPPVPRTGGEDDVREQWGGNRQVSPGEVGVAHRADGEGGGEVVAVPPWDPVQSCFLDQHVAGREQLRQGRGPGGPGTRSAAHMTHRPTARTANTQRAVILTRLKTSTVDRRKITGARNSPVSRVSRA